MKENPLTMEMLLDQLIGLDIIQYAVPMILLCVLEWILQLFKKRLLQQLRHSGHFYRYRKCGISALLKRDFLNYAVFYNVVPGAYVSGGPIFFALLL
jgi:hypothetical protein